MRVSTQQVQELYGLTQTCEPNLGHMEAADRDNLCRIFHAFLGGTQEVPGLAMDIAGLRGRLRAIGRLPDPANLLRVAMGHLLQEDADLEEAMRPQTAELRGLIHNLGELVFPAQTREDQLERLLDDLEVLQQLGQRDPQQAPEELMDRLHLEFQDGEGDVFQASRIYCRRFLALMGVMGIPCDEPNIPVPAFFGFNGGQEVPVFGNSDQEQAVFNGLSDLYRAVPKLQGVTSSQKQRLVTFLCRELRRIRDGAQHTALAGLILPMQEGRMTKSAAKRK